MSILKQILSVLTKPKMRVIKYNKITDISNTKKDQS